MIFINENHYDSPHGLLSRLGQIISQFQLFSFFILAYALMFASVFIDLFIIDIPDPVTWAVSAWSPTIAAVTVSGITGGTEKIKVLLKGFLKFRVGAAWYLAALMMFFGPLAAAVVYVALGGESPGTAAGLTLEILLYNLSFSFLSGPLSEEAGWRGFALPRLESKYNALVSSLILGVIWACWHVPLYFVPGSAQSGIPLPIYLVMVTVLSVLFTWLYNNTGGSLALTVLMHFSFNFVSIFIPSLLGLVSQMVFFIIGGTLLGIYVVVVIIIFKSENLSRKPNSELPFTRF